MLELAGSPGSPDPALSNLSSSPKMKQIIVTHTQAFEGREKPVPPSALSERKLLNSLLWKDGHQHRERALEGKVFPPDRMEPAALEQ